MNSFNVKSINGFQFATCSVLCDSKRRRRRRRSRPKKKYILTLMDVVEDAEGGWLLLLLLGVAGDRPGHQDGQYYHKEDFHFSPFYSQTGQFKMQSYVWARTSSCPPVLWLCVCLSVTGAEIGITLLETLVFHDPQKLYLEWCVRVTTI